MQDHDENAVSDSSSDFSALLESEPPPQSVLGFLQIFCVSEELEQKPLWPSRVVEQEPLWPWRRLVVEQELLYVGTLVVERELLWLFPEPLGSALSWKRCQVWKHCNLWGSCGQGDA